MSPRFIKLMGALCGTLLVVGLAMGQALPQSGRTSSATFNGGTISNSTVFTVTPGDGGVVQVNGGLKVTGDAGFQALTVVGDAGVTGNLGVSGSITLPGVTNNEIALTGIGSGITFETGTFDTTIYGGTGKLAWKVSGTDWFWLAVGTGYLNALYGYTTAAAAGTNAFAASVNGARFDFGTGASDYLYSDGTNINTPGDLYAVSFRMTGGSLYQNTANAPVIVGSTNGFRVTPGTLGTCGSGSVLEGTIQNVAGSGAVLGKHCYCAFDGSTYQWINLLNPSTRTGNTTTCPAS